VEGSGAGPESSAVKHSDRAHDTLGLTAKSKPITLVVRRGALRRFDRLKQATRELPADVIWDRRGAGKGPASGAHADGPAQDRRKATAPTWDMADFVVTSKADAPPRRRPFTKKS